MEKEKQPPPKNGHSDSQNAAISAESMFLLDPSPQPRVFLKMSKIYK